MQEVRSPQYYYALRGGFQSEAAGFRKSSTRSTTPIQNRHNSETIPEGFDTVQLPFLPPSTLSYEDSTTAALTQPPSAIASHLNPLTKTEIILPLQLFSSTS